MDLVEDDIRLVLDEEKSSFITDDLPTGNYAFKYHSDFPLKNPQSEFERVNNTVEVDFDHVSIKIKLVVRPGILAIRFDKKSFLRSIPGFISHWYYKHYNECISHKNLDLCKLRKIHSECDCIDGSVLKGLGQPIIYSSVLDKRSGY